MSSTTTKLTESLRAFALLRKMFQDGEIGPKDPPITV